MSYDFESFQKILLMALDAAFSHRDRDLLFGRIHAVKIRKQKSSSSVAGRHDDAVSFNVELVHGIDIFGLSEHVDIVSG